MYVVIKLASIVDPVEKDKISGRDPIVINAMDPCFSKTGLHTEVTSVVYTLFESLFARSAEEASRLVVGATAAGRESHGKYFRGGAIQNYASFLTSKDGAKRGDEVWEQLSRRLEELQPGIMNNLNTS